jgi:hypothetical protein
MTVSCFSKFFWGNAGLLFKKLGEVRVVSKVKLASYF